MDDNLLKNNDLDDLINDAPGRVGNRIRAIRKDRYLTQGQLGEMVGLSADRIQQYENGFRKPKPGLLKRIAKALDVSPLALIDPVTTTEIGALYALFEIENHFGLEIITIDENSNPKVCITADRLSPLYNFLLEWSSVYKKTHDKLDKATTDEERKAIMKSYRNWEWSFSPEKNIQKKT